ncbi:GNAT family N-acetyltransferase [uncultured Maritimibacter sp.]|uniref:GNAT family N-acetyltransferase n=1 Tax=uncultured Maritimibacter sp. TaxID=991866 RepID=UPI000A9958B4|nr:GNAT family N-acetyltransferase [uncultured Maritimibacter sp.]
MTYDDLAAVYAAAFAYERGWSAAEIESLATGPGGFVVTEPQGFALGRTIAGEAELLTIAVLPAAQGQGIGRRLLAAFEAEARAGTAFLEVAEDNAPARHLYERCGWVEAGRRRAYYARAGGPAVDAVLMSKRLA